MCHLCFCKCVASGHEGGMLMESQTLLSPGLLLLLEPDAFQALGAGDEGDVPTLFH